jgi:hypothetical protein
VVRPVENAGVIYEVNLEADTGIEAAFDTWLRDHVADMLQLPGFRAAEILGDAAAPAGRIRRTVQYRLTDQAALDDYLRIHAPEMRARGAALFGEQFRAERRVLDHREDFTAGAVYTDNCLNCGEVLTGQHCSHCGQRAAVQVISLWSLVRDFLVDVFDWDARVWRTLRPLAFRPGLLTQEYLRGRRAHYTPPVRMYLVLSVAFFLIGSLFDPGTDLRLQVGDRGASLTTDDGRPAASDPAGVAPEQLERAQKVVDDPCGADNVRLDGSVLEPYETQLRRACHEIVTDTPSFGRAVWENVPKMMFLFLPLIALVMAALYLGSKRYYVEHLLFFLHYHSFFFLAGIVVLVLDRLGAATTGSTSGLFESAENLLILVLIIYVPVYLYRAMRRVYGQGRFLTAIKFTTLAVAYLCCLVLTGVGLLVYTALTV